MDPSQIESAIEVLWSQTSDHALKQQALDFTQQLRNESAAWQPCLLLFTRSPPASETVRHFALEIVASSIEKLGLDHQSLDYMRGGLDEYVKRIYGSNGADKVDSPPIQNKLAQVLTLLFESLYDSTWQSIFDDYLQLAKDGMAAGGNTAATILYFRLLGSIHDDIADMLIQKSPEKTKRTTLLRDRIRERDAPKIASYWQELLADWQSVDPQVLEMCLRTVARWVSWSDISMVINQPILDALLQMTGQQDVGPASGTQAKLRDAAIEAFTAIASKKMRPSEKVELIKVLNLQTVISQLIASRPLSELRSTPNYDTDLAESVAKLVNYIVRDLVVILEAADASDTTKQEANTMLQVFIPFALRFFTDEYDEICNTVIDGLAEVLSLLRRLTKDKQGQSVPVEYASLLPSILHAIIEKMKYDDTASWGEDGEESDEAEFQELRKRLHNLQAQITFIDENLVTTTVSNLVLQTFRGYTASPGSTDWRDVELALYQMHLFGEAAVKQANRGKISKPSAAADQLGVMVLEMINSKIGQSQHAAVQLQFADNCVRYSRFFETNAACIPPALEALVSYAHSTNSRVRLSSWYSFQRFTRAVRSHLGEVSQTIIQAVSDLLPIKAVLPGDREEDEDDSSNDGSNYNDPIFNSQLYLFEAIGCVMSCSTMSTETKVYYVQSIVNPIFTDLQQNLEAAKAGDERAVMQIHHDILALGSVSHGFTDWMPGVKVGEPPAPEIADVFIRCGEAILVALNALNTISVIRQAAQSSLARLIGGMGSRVLTQLPRWIEGLLSQASTKDEIITFLHLLTQIIFAFKAEIASVLDAVLTPLLQRVFERLSEPATGTDDEFQLGELRRKFLSFISAVLLHDLGSVLISANNQITFENTISAIEHFAKDSTDISTARSAFGAIQRIINVWGGPTLASIPQSEGQTNATAAPSSSSAPPLPGFDAFMITRFSPLSWAIPSSPGFKTRDAGSRLLIFEIASMQQEIFKRTGQTYLVALSSELQKLGAGEQDVANYVGKLQGDLKAFREFLVQFLSRD